MKFRFILFALAFSTLLNTAYAQRRSFTINESWKFSKDGENTSKIVSIPHTWNAKDATDDEIPGYYRGIGWYKKDMNISKKADENLYICFDGANQEVELFVNGKSVGTHSGGYTRFVFDISEYVLDGTNSFAVKVDNTHNVNIPPLTADFTFFGGIYRDISLLYTPKTHIAASHYGSTGVYITTPEVSEQSATVEIKTLIDNNFEKNNTVKVKSVIVDANSKIVASKISKVKISKQSREELIQKIEIPNPKLWSIAEPNLYKVYSSLIDNKGNETDCVINPLGIRSFSFDPEKGFFLNGEHIKLIGTNRHQDYFQKGNALNDEMHVRDVKLLKNMGGNFLRIAHYPQDRIITQMCDKLGIVSSVEIPVINEVTDSPEFEQNAKNMLLEMIYQDFNSPSVIIWAYMNEIMLTPRYDKNDPQDKETYLKAVERIATTLENTIRATDNTRYTMMACHGNESAYREAGVTKLPMILGWNLYHGWYGNGSFKGFEGQLSKLHKSYPNQSLIVTEYGADVDPRLHSFDPSRFDFTAEYGDLFHEHYLKQIIKHDFITGANIWNINDFYSETRADAVPHVNNKGITGLNREIKDTYYLYKARLTKEPMIKIGSSNWKVRGGVVNSNYQCIQTLKVYTNAKNVSLRVNGEEIGTSAVNEHIAQFEVPFVHGTNVIEASAIVGEQSISDIYTVDFRAVSSNLKDAKLPFQELNMLLGSKRYFEDREAAMVWIPEQAYTPGGWGYIGGEAVKAKTKYGTLPAFETNILGTDQDPIFQTQREGLEAVQFDVEDGEYYVYLYFAELATSSEQEALAYNLGNDAIGNKLNEQRIFTVSVNGVPYLNELNLAQQCGEARAVIKRLKINAVSNQGIRIDFKATSGKSILNAIRIYKAY